MILHKIDPKSIQYIKASKLYDACTNTESMELLGCSRVTLLRALTTGVRAETMIKIRRGLKQVPDTAYLVEWLMDRKKGQEQFC